MNQITAWFLIICAFCLGIALGGYIASLRKDKMVNGRGAGSLPDDLLRVRKDTDSGALHIFVAGQSFHSPAEMTTVHRTLVGYMVNDVQAWLCPLAAPGKPALAAVPQEIAPAMPAADGSPTAQEVPAGSVVAGEIQAIASPSAPSTPDIGADVENQASDDPKKRKRGGFVGLITRALGSDVPNLRPVTKSIAVQVNEILQKKLKDTPLAERAICLMELPGQEMVVMIGLDKYDSVNAVPDDEIRAVIQSAVNDWLAKSG